MDSWVELEPVVLYLAHVRMQEEENKFLYLFLEDVMYIFLALNADVVLSLR